VRFISVIDFFLPAVARNDHRKAQPTRLLVAICLVAAVCEPLMSLRHFLLADDARAGGLTLVVAALALALLAAIRRGLPPRLTMDIVVAIVIVASTAVSLARGGFYISTLLASTLIPLVTGLVGRQRATIVWASIAALVLAVVAAVTHSGFHGLRRETAVDAAPLLLYLFMTTVISVVYQHSRKDLEREREALERRIGTTQRLEALGNLAAGVAHDFNNLLTIFAAAGESMVEGLPADHRLRPDADAVCEAAARGATIARQLLVFANPQTREPDAFELVTTVRAMEPLLRRALPEAITLHIEAPSTPFRVSGDSGQLMNVILNLVVNARDAMPSGGSVGIALAERPGSADAERPLARGRHVAIVVRDTGSGIAPDVVSHIFEPFFTTKTRERGSGLGLATAYGTVRAMKGEIAVETAVGSGTTFEILLPILDASSAAVRVASPAIAPTSARQKVLVVDDQPELAAAVRRLLDRDFEVLTAVGAEEALAMFAEHSGVEVVLTDICMPGIGGIELAARLRQMKPSIAIVYMTGYSDDEAIAREVESGMARMIHKPFDRAGLRREIVAASRGAGMLGACTPPAVLPSRLSSSSSQAAAR
jgi:signal transduction histidine kinase/ActR/RegA family two-component response regulator